MIWIDWFFIVYHDDESWWFMIHLYFYFCWFLVEYMQIYRETKAIFLIIWGCRLQMFNIWCPHLQSKVSGAVLNARTCQNRQFLFTDAFPNVLRPEQLNGKPLKLRYSILVNIGYVGIVFWQRSGLVILVVSNVRAQRASKPIEP